MVKQEEQPAGIIEEDWILIAQEYVLKDTRIAVKNVVHALRAAEYSLVKI